MGRLVDAAREHDEALALLAVMIVDLAERAEADADECAELADLLVTLGFDNDDELTALDPSYADDQAAADDQADESGTDD